MKFIANQLTLIIVIARSEATKQSQNGIDSGLSFLAMTGERIHLLLMTLIVGDILNTVAVKEK